MNTNADNECDGREPASGSSRTVIVRIVVLIAVAATAYWAYRNYGGALRLDNPAAKETELRQYQSDHPVLVYGIAFLIYVSVTGLSLPGAAVLTLVFGWYFGFVRALVLVSFASTAGATIAFLLSRYLFRDAMQRRFGERLRSLNASLEREGAFYLFTLRLIPAIPFFVLNVVMGLTPVKTTTYWWVSQLGMLPGTAVYVYAGSQFPNLKKLAKDGASGILTPQLIAAFVVLGVFPIVVKKLMGKLKPTGAGSES